jgi:5'-nucleotidase
VPQRSAPDEEGDKVPRLRPLAAATLGVLIVLSLTWLPGPATAEPSPDTAQLVDVTLLNINDFHGRIDNNTVNFAATIERLRAVAGEDNTLLLSAGDNLGASLFASAIADDEPTLDVLNAVELKASAVGNHEFDRGWDDLKNRVEDYATFPYLGANVYAKGTTTPVLDEYVVLDAAGLRVAVIGTVTQETPTLVSPAGVADLDFGDPVEATNRVAAKIVAEDLADVIVAEYHDGAPAGQAEDATLEQELAESATFAHIVDDTAPSVDVLFTGHTHKLYSWNAALPGAPETTRPVIQTGSYGANIGVATLTIDTTTEAVTGYTSTTVATSEPASEEEIAASPRLTEVQQIVDAALANAEAIGSEPVGRIAADVTRAAAGGTYSSDGIYTGGTPDDRSEASTIGRLVGNALRDTLQAIDADVDFGVVNPGGLRADLLYATNNGTIDFAQLLSVLPFNNNLSIVSLSGQQVITMLNQQWQRDAAGHLPSRPYLQLGLSDDVTYTYTEANSTCTSAAGAESVECLTGSVTAVLVDGQPIDPTGEYKIATFSFLAAGGDNFWVFQDSAKVVDTGMLDWEGWVNYVAAASADEPIVPDHSRAGVRVEGLPDELTAGDAVSLQVSKLNVMSQGSPAAVAVTAFIDDSPLGTFPVADGAALVEFTLPDTLSGPHRLALQATGNPTHVEIPVTIEAKTIEPPVFEPTLTLSTASLTPGSQLTVTIADGQPSLPVDVWLYSDPVLLGQGTLDAAGGFSLTATVPATTAPGAHTIVVVGDGLDLRATIAVSAAPTTTPPATQPPNKDLATTGASVPLGLLALAVAAMAVGGFALLEGSGRRLVDHQLGRS